ncbi:hypothetical protein D3C81_2014940 [compost metagenome]
MDDVAPEARYQPVGEGVAEQVFGMWRDVAVSEIADTCFPGNGRKTLHQPAVMIFAGAQFLLQIDPACDFRTQAPIDANHRGQDDDQQQYAGQAVFQ